MPVTGTKQPAVNPPQLPANALGWTIVGSFLGLVAVDIANGFAGFWPPPSWMPGALVILGFTASIGAISPPLPAVNVLMAAGIAATIGGLAVAVSVVLNHPLGHFEFRPSVGFKIANVLPWWIPLVWATIALSSRGTARFLLHTRRKHPQHGYRVIAAATLLAILSTILLNRFGMCGDHYWRQETAGPLLYSSGHVLHLIIQVAVTALLIDKFPGERPANARPVVVWLGANILFVAEAILA